MQQNTIRFATLAALFFSLQAQSQPTQSYVELGAAGDYRLAAATGGGTYRVGNAVLVRLAAVHKEGGGFAPLVLASCNGTWLTPSIQATYKFDGPATFNDLFILAKDQEERPLLDAVSPQPSDETPLFYAKPLFKRVSAICKSASKEPRNQLIPVSESANGDDAGSTTSIVLGTSVKTATSVDVWTRTTHYRLTPYLDNDGKPVEYEGKVQKKKEPTGKYSMERRAFNCSDRTLAVYEFAEYEAAGKTPTSWSVPRTKSAFSSAVPNSVGEAQLDAACSIYVSN